MTFKSKLNLTLNQRGWRLVLLNIERILVDIRGIVVVLVEVDDIGGRHTTGGGAGAPKRRCLLCHALDGGEEAGAVLLDLDGRQR